MKLLATALGFWLVLIGAIVIGGEYGPHGLALMVACLSLAYTACWLVAAYTRLEGDHYRGALVLRVSSVVVLSIALTAFAFHQLPMH
jgi:hypothetical protein